MKTMRFRQEAETNFYAAARRRVNDYFRRTGKPRGADRVFWFKAACYTLVAAACYTLILTQPLPLWTLYPAAVVYGLMTLLLGINVGHDAAHGTASKRPWVNEGLVFGTFTLIGVNGYLWTMRHTKSHHIFPNVNGSDIDIDENPFVRLSPNQPWIWYQRWQHLYAPFLYAFVTLHAILWQDFLYLRKRELANLRGISHPRRQYASFALSKSLYVLITLVVPFAVIPAAWWQVLLGYLLMTGVGSLAFVFMLIGTHFNEGAEFPVPDADGNLPHTWAEHNLLTACDWVPTNRVAHFLAGGVNAHAAHHLFPKVCHTHYPAVAEIIIATAAEYGVKYNRTGIGGLVRGHFAFLRRLGRRPAAACAGS